MPIRLWGVYHVQNCVHSVPPKNKFVVIACFDPKPYGFFVNSIVNPFWHKQNLVVCHAEIKQSEHGFLTHDSFVDCTVIHPYENSMLTTLVGTLSASAQVDVKNSVNLCRILARHYKNLIVT